MRRLTIALLFAAAGCGSPATDPTTPVASNATAAPGSTVPAASAASPPPIPALCPEPSPAPTVDESGRYCGPPPHEGNGLGPHGMCTGAETFAPCGPGV